jgi:pentatricopeptide repeat protein
MRWATLVRRGYRCGGSRKGQCFVDVSPSAATHIDRFYGHMIMLQRWKLRNLLPHYNNMQYIKPYIRSRRQIFQSSIENKYSLLENAQKTNKFKQHRYASFLLTRYYSSFSDDFDQFNMDADLDDLPELNAIGDVDWESKPTVTMDATRAEQIYHESRKLLYNLTVMPQQEASRPENWTEIEHVLRNLSNTRTAEAVALSWTLLEAIIKNLNTSRDPVTTSEDDDTEYDLAHAQFLTDWDLWYSILVNWHQVSKDSLDFVNSTPATKIMKPSELLSKLDEWNGIIKNATMKFTKRNQEYDPYQELFDCTNSRTLSLLIDIVARFGKRLFNAPNSVPKELVPYAEFAENLLLRMTERSEFVAMRSETNFPPSSVNLNMVLMLWARALMVDRAWALLQYAINSSVIHPDLWSYNSVIHAYSKAGDGKSAERVLYELLQQQQKEHDKDEFDEAISSQRKEIDVIQPSIITWNSVLAAWARSVDKVKGAERVEQLLGTMVAYSNGGRISYSSDGLINVERLDEMNGKRASPTLQQSVKPNVITLNTALSAWARAGEAETCARLLSEMRELYNAGQLSDPPDVFSYATVMNGFAKANQPEKAEALWDGMYQAYKQGAKELKPTLPMMSTILDAYARQIMNAVSMKKYETAFSGLARAERSFERMRELFLSGDLDSSLDTAAYNIMLKCYLYCARANALPKDADMTASIADELLLEMKKLYESKQIDAAPTFTTYSIVIQAWLTRSDGVERAIQLLDEAWQKQTTGDPRMKPDQMTITSLVTAFCYAKQPKVAQKFLLSVCEVRQLDPSGMVEPKIDSFGTVFAALQRSSDDDTATYAQNLFDQMMDLHKLEVISYEPDSLIYQSLLSIWANSAMHGASKMAYDIYHEMKQLAAQGDKSMEPDLKTCHQVLFSLSGKNPEPVIAESMVRQMYADYKSNISNVKPDSKTFNYALSAWARSAHPDSINHADALFKEMQIMHKDGEITCDVVTFNILLDCLAKSSKREAAERAEKLLLRMIELADSGLEGFRPTAVSYGCLISAWVRVLDLPRAEAILVNMFRESQNGKEYLKPHVRHFEQVSRAWLSTNDRDKKNRSQAVQNLMKLVYPSLISSSLKSEKGRDNR